MEFQQLLCFVTVAEKKSFSCAARELDLSQPAVTRNIQSLEEDLGIALFTRNGKRFVLSKAGHAVLQSATSLLQQSYAIRQTCQDVQQGVTARLKFMISAGSLYLPELVMAIQQEYPSVALSMFLSNPKRDTADIFLSSSARKWEETYRRSVMSEDLVIAVPLAHPLANRESISLEELSKYPILSLCTDSDMRMAEELYAKAARVTFTRAIECESPATLCALLKYGIGPALVPTKSWSEVYNPSVLLLPIQGQKCIRHINVELLRSDDTEDIDEVALSVFNFIVEFFQDYRSEQSVACNTEFSPEDEAQSE